MGKAYANAWTFLDINPHNLFLFYEITFETISAPAEILFGGRGSKWVKAGTTCLILDEAEWRNPSERKHIINPLGQI